MVKTRTLDIILNGKLIKKDFEVPEEWSDTAATIAASKYATDDENSAIQIIDRVVDQITEWGTEQNYFGETLPGEETFAFSRQLKEILINQRGAFNTPVYLNIGIKNQPQVSSACFLATIEDTIEDILEHNTRAGLIFKGGSGVGFNISKLRAKEEKLSNKGTSSGPVSFLRFFDRSAGAIRSGGKSRRSSVLVAMDADHPDIQEFIHCKSEEEKKARILIDNGISRDEAYSTVDFQNANHSVSVSDKFMRAVEEDKDWDLINRGDKKVVKTLKARDLFNEIVEQAWATGDPGLQFIDTINNMNPLKNTGRIESSNPCLTGDMQLLTAEGYIPIKDLVGKKVNIIIPILNDTVSFGKVWSNGIKDTVKITLEDGTILKSTPDHIWKLINNQECQAKDLAGKKLQHSSRMLTHTTVIKVEDNGQEEVFDFEEPITHWGVVEGYICHNCGEVFLPPWSCCQLFCFNLPKYLDSNNQLDIDLLKSDIDIVVTAMDIILGSADYPIPEFKKEAIETRPLGIGATDLAGYLIRKGLAYNSEEGRKEAADAIGLITLFCMEASYNLAHKLGPFERFKDEKKSCIEAYKKLLQIDLGKTFPWWWDSACDIGFRNCTVTALAPNGTSGLLVGGDGQGIEPLFALETTKTLFDGGELKLIPKCVEKYKESLKKPIYKQGQTDPINFSKAAENPEILLTANEISWQDHLKMVAVLQQVISMGISKTCNLPSNATIEDIKDVYMMAWKLKLKGVTIYRNGCKAWQPLTDSSKKKSKDIKPLEKPEGWVVTRRKLDNDCDTLRHKFDIAGFEGYIHTGLYEDGKPGEVFIRASKTGSTIEGLLDGFATLFSLGLQYGIPLGDLVNKFKGQNFPPNGITQNENIRMCSSVIDYVAKYLEKEFLSEDKEFDSSKVYTSPATEKAIEVFSRLANTKNSLEGPPCIECGGLTYKFGGSGCWTCSVCGSGGGCS